MSCNKFVLSLCRHRYRSVSPAHRVLSSKPAGHCCCCQLLRQTDGQNSTPSCHIDPSLHTMQSGSDPFVSAL